MNIKEDGLKIVGGLINMKFFMRCCDLEIFNENHENLLLYVYFNVYGRAGSIRKIGHPLIRRDGWIYESDNHFHLYAKIKYGFSPIPIADEEYEQIKRDGVSFLSKERTKQLREAIAELPNR